MSVQVHRAPYPETTLERRSRRMREAASFLHEEGWEGGSYRESDRLRAWSKGVRPRNDRAVVIEDDGTTWLYHFGVEDGPHHLHSPEGWAAFREFVTGEES